MEYHVVSWLTFHLVLSQHPRHLWGPQIQRKRSRVDFWRPKHFSRVRICWRRSLSHVWRQSCPDYQRTPCRRDPTRDNETFPPGSATNTSQVMRGSRNTSIKTKMLSSPVDCTGWSSSACVVNNFGSALLISIEINVGRSIRKTTKSKRIDLSKKIFSGKICTLYRPKKKQTVVANGVHCSFYVPKNDTKSFKSSCPLAGRLQRLDLFLIAMHYTRAVHGPEFCSSRSYSQTQRLACLKPSIFIAL